MPQQHVMAQEHGEHGEHVEHVEHVERGGSKTSRRWASTRES